MDMKKIKNLLDKKTFMNIISTKTVDMVEIEVRLFE
jgi:hypothetical protein